MCELEQDWGQRKRKVKSICRRNHTIFYNCTYVFLNLAWTTNVSTKWNFRETKEDISSFGNSVRTSSSKQAQARYRLKHSFTGDNRWFTVSIFGLKRDVRTPCSESASHEHKCNLHDAKLFCSFKIW